MDLELCVAAELSNLPVVRGFIRKAALEVCSNEAFAYDAALAVDELVTNIIVHGYRHETGFVQIQARHQADALVVTLRDQARPFNPTTVEKPDLTRPLEERRIGGLGVYLARTLTDNMIYQWTPEGGNELILIKNCSNHLAGSAA